VPEAVDLITTKKNFSRDVLEQWYRLLDGGF
jgi:hypothetical protein